MMILALFLSEYQFEYEEHFQLDLVQYVVTAGELLFMCVCLVCLFSSFVFTSWEISKIVPPAAPDIWLLLCLQIQE